MSIQDLLQKYVKQVAGPNILLVVSSLPIEHTVEVKKWIFNIVSFVELLFSNRNLLDN